MSPRRLVVAIVACVVLTGVCAWSFWLPNRTFDDDRGILDKQHIDYGVAFSDAPTASSSSYKLRFLRTSDDEVRVDVAVEVTNEQPNELQTTCYYLVPPGSELVDPGDVGSDRVDPDGDGSFTITGDDLAKWEVPFFNSQGVELLRKYSDQGFWLYDQPCGAAAAPTDGDETLSSGSTFGASFSVPDNVFFQTAYRTYELDFDLQGVPVFGYGSSELLPSDDVATTVKWAGDVTYQLDGKGWSVTGRVPDGHRQVTATSSMASYQVTPETSFDSPALSHPNFTMQGATNSLPLTMAQILSTLLLGVIADRTFEGLRAFPGSAGEGSAGGKATGGKSPVPPGKAPRGPRPPSLPPSKQQKPKKKPSKAKSKKK